MYRPYNNNDWVWAPYYAIHKQLAGLIDIATYVDDKDIADYAKASVAVLSSYGVVNGVGANEFNPGGLCTRAQAAKIIANMLSVCNSLGIGR